MQLEVIRDAGRRPLCARISGLLSEGQRRALYAATLEERPWFVDASTGGRDDYRRAQVRYTPPDEAELVVAPLMARTGAVCRALGVRDFSPARVESQLVAHGDGAFYGPHTDAKGPDVGARALSYVYYFHRVPQAFAGGALALRHDVQDPWVAVSPANNTLVVFASHLEHEVQRVTLPGDDFADRRFALTGWLWRPLPS